MLDRYYLWTYACGCPGAAHAHTFPDSPAVREAVLDVLETHVSPACPDRAAGHTGHLVYLPESNPAWGALATALTARGLPVPTFLAV